MDNVCQTPGLQRECFDGMNLSLSLAFSREDGMPRMASTIGAVRAASLNPALVVVVPSFQASAARG